VRGDSISSLSSAEGTRLEAVGETIPEYANEKGAESTKKADELDELPSLPVTPIRPVPGGVN